MDTSLNPFDDRYSTEIEDGLYHHNSLSSNSSDIYTPSYDVSVSSLSTLADMSLYEQPEEEDELVTDDEGEAEFGEKDSEGSGADSHDHDEHDHGEHNQDGHHEHNECEHDEHDEDEVCTTSLTVTNIVH
jgi:hypothetical protein